MNTPTRREALRAFLHGALQAAGTVILASAAIPQAQANLARTDAGSPQDRADRLAGKDATRDGAEELCNFANGAFRNAYGGAFRKGAFANGGTGGAFRKGGFANGSSGGAFKNAGFANGGSGGAFKNAGFRNY